MRKKKSCILYSKERGFYRSSEPGRFAAIVTQKIAGRLDCPSGKRAKPKNRMFLLHLEDMPRGFRPCKICRPEALLVGDRLDCLEKRAAKLESRPHISLWATGILKPGQDKSYEPCRWYVALNWKASGGEWGIAQHTLSRHHRYHRALSLALQEGRRLNLPVVKHGIVGLTVLWLPAGESSAEQKELMAALQSGKVASVFGDGVICV